MKQYASIILFWGFTVFAQNGAGMKEAIKNLTDSVEGNFSAAYVNLNDSADTLFVDADRTHHAASTMKTAVMVEVMRRAMLGEFSLQDSITVENSFTSIYDGSTYSMDLSSDSGEKLYEYIGQKLTIYDLVFDMITVSSNLATNILIEKISADSVMKTLKDLGVEGLTVLRGVEDSKAYNAGMNNTTTARGLASLFTAIYQKKYPDEKYYSIMMDILLAQKFNDKIPKYLPDNVKVAHKTGSITGVNHDSGIVILPDGRAYVAVVMASGLKDTEKGVEVLARISEIMYNHFSR